ncbi:hypothetical protein DPEC_G00152400 [Dallia pectoralis]|uniref:Uncharacterized protein n=1 Tax=Dallia pectoralis TaxID=75939 RepID=A0ACC2GJ80_DALPE|nr:hypothetical protein DPEC_G00152400 [Dallia pectoralis]
MSGFQSWLISPGAKHFPAGHLQNQSPVHRRAAPKKPMDSSVSSHLQGTDQKCAAQIKRKNSAPQSEDHGGSR